MPVSVRHWNGSTWTPYGSSSTETPSALAYDWSDSNVPWAYPSSAAAAEALFTADWPSGITIVDIPTASGDFYTNLKNVCDAASGPIVVRLGTGVYHMNQFRLVGSSGDPRYAFGFFHPRLQGFLGKGPDKTIIQMDANSLSTEQLDAMKTMTAASFAPLQTGMMLIGYPSVVPTVYIAGVTFQSADQQNLTEVAADLVAKNVYVPQPAPHNGVVIFQNANARISYTRFRAAGRALYSAPPFEHANIGSQYGDIVFNNCEFDGRRAPELDPAQPRRCGPVMGNNEDSHTMRDCWMHHSNVSRYAVNDENRDTSGPYSLIRCKIEQITNTRNTDPAINGGNTLGGYTNACLMGWESCNSVVTLTDCIMSVDNPNVDVSLSSSQHLQFTSVGSRNPQGGRLHMSGCTARNTGFPHLDGYITVRCVTSTYWYSDGFATTFDVKGKSGQQLTPYIHTGTWPTTLAALTAAGASPETHYIVRTS